jgi:hypothetical protein
MCRLENPGRTRFPANFSELPDSGILYTLRCQLLFPTDNSTDARGFPGRILRGDEFEYWSVRLRLSKWENVAARRGVGIESSLTDLAETRA